MSQPRVVCVCVCACAEGLGRESGGARGDLDSPPQKSGNPGLVSLFLGFALAISKVTAGFTYSLIYSQNKY